MSENETQALNREAWLTQFTALVLPLIKQRTGLALPDGTYKLSCGFPSTGGTRRKNRTVGECFHVQGGQEGRKFHQVFIHPMLVDPVDIGGTIVHEILHAMLPAGVGHRKPFAKAAERCGLEGKPTHTAPGDELAERLKEIAEQLGPYPHESLNVGGGPVQGTRLIKCMCPLCGYLVRTTYKWIDEAGTPICPQCLVSMEEASVGEEAATPLTAIEQTVEYGVKLTPEMKQAFQAKGIKIQWDPRWSVRMVRKGSDIRWWILDYGPSVVDGMAALGTGDPSSPDYAPGPRLTPAESRQDAIALLEALREGTMTYDDIEVDDDNPDLDVDDPFYEDEHEETADYEDGELTEEELAEYEAEVENREHRG